ncbi:MAG: thiamine-phosphate kinase [Puniceicoccales bacterium]|jgi:thiamine-monophosphate kinase|nr:thiamine-phosphate kinase [Puniceicoccales bacterium]
MTPFTAESSLSLAALGEVRLLECIRRWLGSVSAPSPRGMGDDCAVLPANPLRGARLVTTDSVIWGRHFDGAVSAWAAGAKLVKRNLSDVAAMGGVPTDAVLSLVCGSDVAVAWLEAFFGGVADECRAFDMELAGGDVAEAHAGFFCATLALTGFAENPVLRSGARVGDSLLVTGFLGGSLAGKHLTFTPRLREGRWVATRPEIRAGMDLSDGLAKDIPALLPLGCDALLEMERVPVSVEARLSAGGDAMRALNRAMGDGEDYELLLAADTPSLPLLLDAWEREFPALPLTPIGRVVPARDGEGGHLVCTMGGRVLETNFGGYAHF